MALIRLMAGGDICLRFQGWKGMSSFDCCSVGRYPIVESIKRGWDLDIHRTYPIKTFSAPLEP